MYSLESLQEAVSNKCFNDIIGMVEEFVGEEQWNALDAALGEQGATNKIARDIAGNLLGLGKRKEPAEKKESTNNKEINKVSKEVTKAPKKNPPAPPSSGSGIVVAGKSLNPPAKKRSPKKNDKPDDGNNPPDEDSGARVLTSNVGKLELPSRKKQVKKKGENGKGNPPESGNGKTKNLPKSQPTEQVEHVQAG